MKTSSYFAALPTGGTDHLLAVLTKEQKDALYNSWVNDFMSIERFAEYYGITEIVAMDLISRYQSPACMNLLREEWGIL